MISKSYIFLYIVGVFSLFLLFGNSTVFYKNYLFSKSTEKDKLLLTPIGKLEHLKENINKYDLIFLGSSKSYIGINPTVVSQELNMTTFNYASMAHWFPTQYSQFKKIVPLLENQTVVWTISYEMFQESSVTRHEEIVKDSMNQTFYLDIFDYFEYLSMGFSNSDILDNMLLKYMNPDFILFVRESIQEKLRGFLNKDLCVSKHIKIKDNVEIDVKPLLDKYNNYFDYRLINGININNAMFYIYKNDGHLACIELEKEYLRKQQKQTFQKIIRVSKKKEKIFQKIIKLFSKNNINLIVNVYWDAPYTYSKNKLLEQQVYMNEVRKYVLENKLVYLNNNNILTNSDFFDASHLNANGADKYSKILSGQLKNAI